MSGIPPGASGLGRPGFADPVIDAQSCFRAVLAALSQPGSVHTVATTLDAPPFDPATAAVLLTLTDSDVPVWLDASLALAWDWLAFHAGAARAASPGAAGIACMTRLPPPGELSAGTDTEPERGATLILQLPALTGGPRLTLRGPGLEGTGGLAAQGLPDDFAARWAANHRLFPRGVDLILCAGHQLCALPRSTRLEPL